MSCCKIDPDDLFAYNTFKVIILDKGYNKHEIPMGTVRTSLEMRDLEPPSQHHNMKLRDYRYCPEYEAAPGEKRWSEIFPKEKYPCQVWDENLVRYPSEEINAAFVTTRVAITDQKYNCGQQNERFEDRNEPNCEYPFIVPDKNEKTVYLAGTENYTLGINHQFQASVLAAKYPRSSNYAGASSALNGQLLDLDGKVLDNYVVPVGRVAKVTPDIIRISKLLEAANANLATATPGDDQSQFYNGIIVMVLISYSNVSGKPTYTYTVQQIPNASYKVFEVRQDGVSTKNNRVILKRAGVKIIFTVTGDIVAFDFQTLLVQAVSAMGLMSIATLMVELIMLYALPLREYYTKVKFEETEDFSDFRDRVRSEHDEDEARVQELNQQLASLRDNGSADYNAYYPLSNVESTGTLNRADQ